LCKKNTIKPWHRHQDRKPQRQRNQYCLKPALFACAVLLLTGSPVLMSHTSTPAWTPSSATYEISSSKVPFKGRVERSLRQDPAGHWIARSSAKAFASRITETSLFNVGPGCTVKTAQFTYERKVFGKTKAWHISTDWTEKQIGYSTQGQTQTSPFNTASLADRLSEQYSVRCFVRSGAEVFSIHVVRKDQLKQQTFKRLGVEILATPQGELETIKVEKEYESDDRKTSLWFAPNLDYQLVKIVQHDDGETITIELRE